MTNVTCKLTAKYREQLRPFTRHLRVCDYTYTFTFTCNIHLKVATEWETV